jgi:2-hydroxyisobutanoyl-CoA mutase small subunit
MPKNVQAASFSSLLETERPGDSLMAETTPPASISPSDRRIRVLIAKVGLDGHDRGAKVVARALRDAGMEVIYTGLHRTPEEVVSAAVQEDADLLGISILSGAHMTLFPRILDLLRASGAEDILLVGGGVIPDEDVPALRALGVADLILQDTPPETIVTRIRELARARRRS